MFHAGTEEVFRIAIAPRGLADRHWQQGLPSPLQLELAIDEVETALMSEHLAHADRGEIATFDPLLRALPGLQADGGRLGRGDVELLFEHLAAASLAGRDTGSNAPTRGMPAAALLILRECMHHLGFNAIVTLRDGMAFRTMYFAK
ncbi:hypothetical protein [Ramlibacter sp. 2FC]|uniref:hypothetical protein n=1 Tax=Ramlibacter sp. 2FC TaxID=2502188 RepID=UPI00201D8E3F|nr:hypothetical protein [Ramlibacter sp. 2FC]